MRKILTILFTIFLFSSFIPNNTHTYTEQQPNIVTQDSITLSIKDSIRTELIQEVDKYISKLFPNSRLTAQTLVTTCEVHNFDIVFAMAQGQIESGFGTAGKAKHTNSVWNVGQHDGRSITTMNKLGLNFTHPDRSIEPYIVLVKTNYLGDKRTYNDLMNRYVNLSGHRYASNPRYETSLRQTYNRIVRTTRIQELFNQLI